MVDKQADAKTAKTPNGGAGRLNVKAAANAAAHAAARGHGPVTRIEVGPDGIVNLPAGVTPDQIHVQGKDLVINLADGSSIVIVNGAQNVPTIEMGNVELPGQNVIALLNLDGQPGVQPAAGPGGSSGGNFTTDPGAIDPGFGVDPLLGPTELSFTAPSVRELQSGVPDAPTVTVPASPATPGGTPPGGVFAPGTQVFEGGLAAHNGLPAGSAAGAGGNVTSGTVTFTAPGGLSSITINGHVVTAGTSFATADGTFAVTGVNLATGVVSYTYTLTTNTAGANTGETFTVVVTDNVNQTATGAFTVSIVDDAPTARADAAGLDAGVYGPLTGNVETSNDTQGADGAHVSGVHASALSTFVTVPAGAAGVTVAGLYGDLTIHQDGSYSYTRHAGTPGGVSDVFNYQLTDGDGSTSATTLTINIANNAPTVVVNTNDQVDAAGHGVVNEAALASGSHSGGSATVTGVIAYTPGDGPDSITIGGVAVDVGAQVTGAHGVLTVTGVDAVNHTVSYSYTLTSPVTAGSANNGANNEGAGDTFAVVVTDVDGSTAATSLVVDVIDDTPVLHVVDGELPTLTLDESNLTAPTNGGVDGSAPDAGLTHASASFAGAFQVTQGADGATTAYALTINGGNGTDSGLVDAQTGQHVVLVLNNGVVEGHVGAADGALSFTVAVDAGGVVTFTQDRSVVQADASNPNDAVSLNSGLISLGATVTDHDGDVATGSIDLGSHLTLLDDGPTITLADASVPALMVDESNLTAATNAGIDGTAPDAGLTHVTADFAHLFVANPGADNGAVVYSLSLAANPREQGEGQEQLPQGPLDSGLIDSQTGQHDVLVLNNGVVEGHVGSADGELAFTIAVDPSTGQVTLTQDRAVVQADGSDPNDAVSLASNLVTLTATITDKDGDSASASVDVGAQVTFLDDGPTITLADASAPALTVDESFLTAATNGGKAGSTPDAAQTHASADFSHLFVANTGADNGSVAYSLSIAAGKQGPLDSGLIDSQTGHHDVLVLHNGVVEGHVGSANGALAFTIAVDPSTGQVTLTQDRAVSQPDGSNPNDSVSLAANLVTLTAAITDSDGDASSASVDLGKQVSFLDDGPSITVSAPGEAQVTLQTSDSHTISILADFDATTADFGGAFHAAVVAGADGQAGSVHWTFALNLTAQGEDSGLKAGATGQTIYLYQLSNGIVVGSTSHTAPSSVLSSSVVFSIAVDSHTGVAVLTQYSEIHHASGSDLATLANGLVTLTGAATVTDHDGDTATSQATVDLGGNVSFVDDKPSIVVGAVSNGSTLETLDHDTLNGGHGQASASFASVFGELHWVGADSPGTLAWGYALSLTQSGENSGLLAGASGQPVYLYQMADGTVVGSTALTAPGSASDASVVFTLAVDGSGKVTLTQVEAIHHASGSDLATLADHLVTLTGTATITDADGDSATGHATLDLGGNIRFGDDTPTITVTAPGEAQVTLQTSDAHTISILADFDHTTADFGGAFQAAVNPGADGQAGPISWNFALNLTAQGEDSGLQAGATGQTIYLYQLSNGTVVGSTSQTAPTSINASVVFSLSVDGDGKVTLTQYSEIHHASGSDLATLADGLVTLTGTASVTDTDGDTASSHATVDLGGNISFVDDKPSIAVGLSLTGLFNPPSLETLDHDTLNGGHGQDSASFASVFGEIHFVGADSPGSIAWTYALGLAQSGEDSGLKAGANGQHVYLYQLADGTVVGSTSHTAPTSVDSSVVFTLAVDGSGKVTLTQFEAIHHASNADLATLANHLVTLTGTATITDADGDTASSHASLDLGGNIVFGDDKPTITASAPGEAQVSLQTQDHDTIGAATDTAVTTANFGGAFQAAVSPGADGQQGQVSWSFALSLTHQGEDSGLQAGAALNDASIKLYLEHGVVVGRAGGSNGAVVFSISVDSQGDVTLTQYSEIHHAQGSDLATLANSLVSLTGTATVTDTDGDHATSHATIDLGGNISFADDKPTISASASSSSQASVETFDHDTLNGGHGQASASFAGVFSESHTVGADSPGTVAWTYALGLAQSGEDSGLKTGANGQHVYLYQLADGTVVGSTSHTAPTSVDSSVVFTLAVDGSGKVTLTQVEAIHHASGSDLASLTDHLVSLIGTATVTDHDGDTATSQAAFDLGPSLSFGDDTPSITVGAPGEAQVTLQTSDQNTIGILAGLDFTTADFGGAFHAAVNAGADGQAGSISWNFALNLTAQGEDSGLKAGATGQTIYLYQLSNGIVVGSTSHTAPSSVLSSSVVFSIAVDSHTGVAVLTQYSEIHHASDSDLATLADGLVTLTGTATVTDTDGDTASSHATVDLGGNIGFVDDKPTISVNLSLTGLFNPPSLETLDHDTLNGGHGQDSASFASVFSESHFVGADSPGSVSWTYALGLAQPGEDSGLKAGANGQHVYLYQLADGTVVGSTSQIAPTSVDSSVVFTLAVDGDGKVTLTQFEAIHHASGSDLATLANNLVTLTGTATITDADGDTASSHASLDLGGNIVFADDKPVAHDDANALHGGTGAQVAGNVITAVGETNAPTGADSVGADGATVTGVEKGTSGSNFTTVGANGVTITGAHGTLLIHQDGSYTYTHTSGSGSDTFKYQLTDHDGDTSTAVLTITVTGSTPTVLITPNSPDVSGNNVVDEAGLAAGSHTGGSATAIGVISYTPGDAPDTVTIGGTPVTGAANQVIHGAHGDLTITAVDTVNHTIAYSYTLTSPLSVAGSGANNEGVGDSFTVTVTDSDGDPATTTLKIDVVDDVPTANPDSNSVPTGSYAAISNTVLSNDAQGADTALVSGAKAAAASSYTSVGSGAGGTVIHGLYGDLTLHQDGSYTYLRSAGTPGGVSDVFNYQLTDKDGDVSTTTLTIAIGNATPTVLITPNSPDVSGNNVVDEAGLAAGSHTGGSATATGVISYTPGDGPDTVTIGGTTVTGAANQVIHGAHGDLTITSVDTVNHTIAYSYTLTSPVSVSGVGNNNEGAGDTFAVVVADSDGSTVSSSLKIDVVDDTPTANPDSNSAPAGSYAAISNNVMTNDVQGADTALVSGAKAAAASSYTSVASGAGGTVIHGLYGDLTLHQDGSYTYLRSAGTPGGVSDVFNYQLTDKDGDVSTTTLTIAIGNAAPTVTVPTEGGSNAVVYETGLAAGSHTGGSNVTSGTISYTAGDGPDTITLSDNGHTLVVNTGTGAVTLDGATVTGAGEVIHGVHGDLLVTSVTSTGVNYSYTLTSPLSVSGPDNNNEGAGDTFAISVKDVDGSTATGSLKIDVIDDVPTAKADTNAVPTGSYAAISNNVMTNDVQGADTALVSGAKAAAASSYTAVASGAGGTVIHGLYGDLTLHQDGSYTYLRSAGTPGGVSDVFNYQLTDHDGDVSSTTLTVSIGNAAPTVTVPTEGGSSALVYEAGLATGSAPNHTAGAAGSNVTSGTIGYTAGDGPDTITLSDNGHNLVINTGTGAVTLDGATVTGAGEVIHGVHGDLLVTSVTSTGVNYSYTLTSPLSVSGVGNNNEGAGDTFAISVKDADGSTATGSLKIDVIDDTPKAVGETVTVTSTVANYNIGYVLDFSQSISNSELNTMLNAVKAGAATVFNSTTGTVTIDVVIFADSAKFVGEYTSLASLNAAIDALNPSAGGTRPTDIGDHTNYTAALQMEMAHYQPALNANNQVFFLSDGNPNEPSGVDTTHPIQAATATAWNTFVNSNGVSVTSIGVGNDITTGPLQAVDVDGHGAPILVADFASLLNVLVAANSAAVHGNIITDGDVLSNDSYGADGGHIQSITVQGVTYTWNSATNVITETGSHTGTIAGSELTNITTAHGATFSFSFATANGHTAGDWTYSPPTSGSGTDTISYTLVDNDGDTKSADLSVTLSTDPASTFAFTSGSSVGTVSGSGNNGTVTGYSVIAAFDQVHDTLDLVGSPVFASNTSGVNGVDSTLTINGTAVKSHAISNGIITFDDTNNYAHALTLSGTGAVAAVVQYLHNNDLGNAGTTVAFVADGNTYVYEQVGATPNAANDILVELKGVTLTNLNSLGGHIAPVVLDLNHDGVHFVGESAGNTFDYGNGEVSTAWAAPGDGVLALETDHGPVVSFTGYVSGATTDLQGLTAFDTNHDGKLDTGDAQFSQFGVIVDGHLVSLTDAGIASINLHSDGKAYTAADGQVQVAGSGSFTYANGATGALADASFANQSVSSSNGQVAAVVNDALHGGHHGPDLDKLIDALKGGGQQAPAGDNGGAPQGPGLNAQAYLNLHAGASDSVNAALQHHHHAMVAHDTVTGAHHA